MSEHYFEIVFHGNDWKFDGRDEVEDPLDEALAEAGMGEVTGGGSGMGICNVDVDATDFDGALGVIRSVLRQLEVALSTEINYHSPDESKSRKYSAYE